MKLGKILLLTCLLGLAAFLPAQASQLALSEAEPGTILANNGDRGFEVSFSIPSARLESVASKGGAFSQLLIEGYGPSGRIGEPELPCSAS